MVRQFVFTNKVLASAAQDLLRQRPFRCELRLAYGSRLPDIRQHALVTPGASNQPDHSVEVVLYSEEWPAQFEQARAELRAALGDAASSIEHIGSTAVPGMAAKPTIDILVVVDEIADFLARLPAVESLGWDYRAKNTFIGSESHLFLRKVVNGKRTHHLHVVRRGSAEIDEYRMFRDELRANPALAADYEEIKWRLARDHADERGTYVLEKKDWVGEVLARLRRTTP